MQNIKIFALVIISSLVLNSCNKEVKEEAKTDSKVWPYGTMYEIFVQSFADSNGDGIGDIKGMTSKLDYLQELGIQGVWLMPISPSPSYHKYDVIDYYGIHPDYGTMDDFKTFVKEAHSRNIKVVIDLVINHTASEHPWFIDAASGPDSKYRDYYVWANLDSVKDQLSKKEITLDSDNITQWHQAEGNEEVYYGFFWGGMPDLNYDNPEVRQEMIKAGKFWLEEVDVDGLRLDAARHIYPDDQAEDSHAFWVEFGDAMRSVKPDVYMVGEVWGEPEDVGPYLQGLPSMFNFDFYHGIQKIVKEEYNYGLVKDLINTQKVYQKIQDNYIDAIFVNNHDQNRLISNVEGNREKSKLSAAILLTLPGMPYIYYGDEIGMLGQKPDPEIREPFLWDYKGKSDDRTYWMEAVNSTDETVIPLSVQKEDPSSTYSFFKYWVQLRNQHEILRFGNLEALSLSENLLGYARVDAENRWIVLHNLTGSNQSVNVKELGASEVLYTFNKKIEENDMLELPPFSSVILQ